MINYKRTKKKLIISYKNLSEDLKLFFKESYPDGYKDYIQKITKPDGEPLFVVPMETEDTSYLIRFDLKIDTLQAKDLDKEMFDSDDKGDDTDFAPMSEALEKDDDLSGSHTERVLNHGSYDSLMDEMTDGGKKKKAINELDEIRNELKEEFNDEDEEEYKDSYTEEDEEDDFEPTEEDLAEVEKDLLGEDSDKKSTTKATSKKKSTTKTSSKKTAPKATAKTTTKKASGAKKA
ncbi:MAG: hypothetical protein IJ764_08360 [Bacteroidales bacterium]|nr:hypothetical protein [Bacteroidales bacterium]